MIAKITRINGVLLAAAFLMCADPAVAGGFVALPTTGPDIRVLGSNDPSADPLFLGSGWAPTTNGYMFVTSQANPFTSVADGSALEIGTFYDAVYRQTSTSTLMFASRLVLNQGVPDDDDDPLNATEVNLIWRSGYDGFSTSAAWYRDTDGFRLQATASTANVISASSSAAARLPAAGNYNPDVVGFRTDTSVDEMNPTSAWYLIQTNATNYTLLDDGVHIRQSASASEGRPQVDWLLGAYAPTAAVPEPSQFALLAVGLMGLSIVTRARRWRA